MSRAHSLSMKSQSFFTGGRKRDSLLSFQLFRVAMRRPAAAFEYHLLAKLWYRPEPAYRNLYIVLRSLRIRSITDRNLIQRSVTSVTRIIYFSSSFFFSLSRDHSEIFPGKYSSCAYSPFTKFLFSLLLRYISNFDP